MGRALAPRSRRGSAASLLELGGNNAMIVAPSADLDLAVRAIVFAAVGTAGQRCTTLRRLIVHETSPTSCSSASSAPTRSVPVGDPREPRHARRPADRRTRFEAMQAALERRAGRRRRGRAAASACWPTSTPAPTTSRPALVRMPAQTDVVREETFAPILYVLAYRELDEAIALHNDVPQGLSSCIFTNDLREAERSCRRAGSRLRHRQRQHRPERRRDRRRVRRREGDRRRPRVRAPTRGRPTCAAQTDTINYSSELPLAQGIVFDVG